MAENQKIVNRVRTRFPALLKKPIVWPEMEALARKGDEKGAVEVGKAELEKSETLTVRNKIAVRNRIERNQFLKLQIKVEAVSRELFRKFGAKLSKIILTSADSTGIIPFFKMKPTLKRVRKANTENYMKYNPVLKAGVAQSVKLGMTNSMDSAQAGIEFFKSRQKENDVVPLVFGDILLELIEADKRAIIAKTSTVFKTIFDRVKKRRIKKGIFKNRFRNQFQSGFSLSQAIWDLRDDNMRKLRRLVSTGIAQGRSAVSMAKDIMSMTLPAATPRAAVPSLGSGTYRSAFKNAQRLARTETNVAYHESEIEYARHKGYKKLWNLSAGHVGPDVCDELAGKVYEPDKVPSLPHPNCTCYLTTVIPGIS